MSPAFVRASYAMILIGAAAIPVGIYEAATISTAFDALIAAIGFAAAGVAVMKLRSTKHWPFD